MSTILLIAVVPALVVATALYAVLAEARHNRVRRTRWEPGIRPGRLERVGTGHS